MDGESIRGGREVFTTAVTAGKAPIGLAGSTTNVEVKQKADRLLDKLGAAREQYLGLLERYIAAIDENRQLKERLCAAVQAMFHDGAYRRERADVEEGPFCSACWERNRKLVRGGKSRASRMRRLS